MMRGDKHFYQYSGNEVVPGGIVETTGQERRDYQTGIHYAQVRFPVNGEFKYGWCDIVDLVKCDPPEAWLADVIVKPESLDYSDIALEVFVNLAKESSSELGSLGNGVLIDYESGKHFHFSEDDTPKFLSSARSIVLELARRIQQLEREQ